MSGLNGDSRSGRPGALLVAYSVIAFSLCVLNGDKLERFFREFVTRVVQTTSFRGGLASDSLQRRMIRPSRQSTPGATIRSEDKSMALTLHRVLKREIGLEVNHLPIG
jgi:hypothetical protein